MQLKQSIPFFSLHMHSMISQGLASESRQMNCRTLKHTTLGVGNMEVTIILPMKVHYSDDGGDGSVCVC